MIKEAIVKIVNKEDLTYEEAYTVMNEIMSGETTATQNAAFLAALSTKSARAETTDEIAGCAAAGGMKVAKHGNRAASSQCGTADCLEALGVNIQQSPAKCKELLNKVGMCFFFAQKYHTSMKYVGAIRRELGFRTVFNILGPLTNPGTPSMQLLGVYDDYLVEPLAQVLINLAILNGKKGHKRNAVLMNAGVALYIGGKADSMNAGIALAEKIIDSGRALETLNQLIEISNSPEVEA